MVLKEFSSILRKKRPIKRASQSALKKATGKTPGGILLKNHWYHTGSATKPRDPIQDFPFETGRYRRRTGLAAHCAPYWHAGGNQVLSNDQY